jgi:DNA-binding NarL/FixJ family response regulator
MSTSEPEVDSRPVEAEFREYALGRLPKQKHHDVYEWAGLVRDPVVAAHLAFAEANYRPSGDMPDEFVKTVYCQEILKKYGTISATVALETRNTSHLSFFSGLVSYQTDVSGIQTLMNIQQMIRDIPVFIAYIYGIMGYGKTDFAFLLLEIFISIYGRENIVLAANIESADLDSTITHYSELIEILSDRRARMQAGEDVEPIVMIIDEAAQIFTGSGSDQQKAKHLAKLLKLARKANANMLLIGQDGKDIGPSLRTLCTAFVHKESQKKAAFYHDVVDRRGVGKIMGLSGVPATSFEDWSTYDEGEFVFDPDAAGEDGESVTQAELDELMEEHKREMIALLAWSTELTNDEIAELYEVSSKTVTRHKQRYSEKYEPLFGDDE